MANMRLMTPLRCLAAAGAMTLLLVSPAVRAQGMDDEPYLTPETPSLTPQPPVTRRIVKRRVCHPCRRGTSVDLSASVGYTAYLGPLFLDKLHGPQVSGAMVVSWGSGVRVGIRVAGFVARVSGTHEPMFWGSEEPVEGRLLVGGYGAVQATFRNGFWVAKGLGLSIYDYSDDHGDDDELLELVIAGGYDLNIGQHVALRLGLEFGTAFLTYRFAANAGLVLRF